MNLIAVSARSIKIAAAFAVILLAGCSVLPTAPPRAVVYDFGPGALASAPAGPPLPAIALAELQTVGTSDTNTAVLYRLAYADARQLRPYQLARWSLSPAQLVAQRLRTQLGQRRAVLRADDAQAAVREDAANGGGNLPTVLRVELEEFSHVFTSAHDSVGLVRLRATLVQPTAAGEKLLGQRLFVVQHPAASADASGGTRALAEASAQVAQDVAQWLQELGR